QGFGIAFVQEDLARPHIKAGRLRWVMKDWSPTWPGLHAFSPSRRHSSPAFNLVLEALRHKG
uniref:LysR substrate-binding domain-containing protein n=1 Tax=Xanthomonas campestris TaxID=339 RepID=UPI001EE82A90